MLRALLKPSAYPKVIACLLILFLSSQCSTARGGKSQETDRALSTIHRVIKRTFANSIEKQSQNTRTYYSKYHAPGKNLLAGYLDKTYRGQLVASILGARRPYRVAFSYRVEKRVNGRFKLSNYDKNLARYYKDKFDDDLASRPDERDVIDDFRPY